MRETKTIELIFNEEIERDNQTFFFKLGWKKYFKDWKTLLIVTIVIVFWDFFQ